MKSTEHFKNCIKLYLDNMATQDAQFRIKLENPKKSLDNCIQFIFSEVQKSGCCGFADEEIYSMAVHYYDEDDIKVGGSKSCRVVVNHTIELTEEEKKEARKRAIEQVQKEAYEKMKAKKTAPKKQEVELRTLF